MLDLELTSGFVCERIELELALPEGKGSILLNELLKLSQAQNTLWGLHVRAERTRPQLTVDVTCIVD